MGRTYIIEPSFILRTGHIKKCTELFALESLKINRKTIVVIPIGAPEIFSNNSKINVKRILPNSYEHILHGDKLFPTSLRSLVEVVFFFFPRNLKNKLTFSLDRTFWYLTNHRKMKIALEQLFKIEKINS